MKRLTNWYNRRKEYRRNNQEELDTLEVYWATSFRSNLKLRKERNANYGQAGLTDEQVYNLCNTELSHTLSFREQKIAVRLNLTEQICVLFDVVEQTGGMNPYPSPIFKKREGDSKLNLKDSLKEQGRTEIDEYFKRKMIDKDVDVYQPGDPFQHPDQFSLQIRKSNVDHPDSGYGVWVKGRIMPGTVIALYPGLVYLVNKLNADVIADNDYMINRYDDVVVDGKQWDRKVHYALQENNALSYAEGTDPKANPKYFKYRNQFGIGNYINHPPKDNSPNVVSYSIDFLDDLDEKHKHYIPNFYAHLPGLFDIPSECFMKSVAIVAKKTIQDEELFMNYRYNPTHPYPDWYHQPDEEEAKRRWAKRTLLFS